MESIMLAAGIGARLSESTKNYPPKCLLKFNGKSLLARHIEILKSSKIQKLTLIVGYKAEEIERRLIPLIKKEGESYKRVIMRVPGFGSSANSYNSFIIIALLDDWKNRKKDSQTVMREAIGKIVTLVLYFFFNSSMIFLIE